MNIFSELVGWRSISSSTNLSLNLYPNTFNFNIMSPTKENALYLTIKQSYFNKILQGKKKKEYREIKDTTFRKYLNIWSEGISACIITIV